ncbi:hypothetical protein TUSST3_30740 [Streptomyces sp. TUS-ST3]|nr:hypothetical protein TUSST3_30740 [Streptomyces sp. TUS-ST3]
MRGWRALGSLVTLRVSFRMLATPPRSDPHGIEASPQFVAQGKATDGAAADQCVYALVLLGAEGNLRLRRSGRA